MVAAYDVAGKLMYGSDWHVVELATSRAEDYYRTFEEVFDGQLGELRERFFRANAIRYLNLRGFLDRSGDALSEAERQYLARFTG